MISRDELMQSATGQYPLRLHGRSVLVVGFECCFDGHDTWENVKYQYTDLPIFGSYTLPLDIFLEVAEVEEIIVGARKK